MYAKITLGLAFLALAAILAFGFVFYTIVSATPADAGRSVLTRALRDVNTNPTGWRSQWCGRAMAMWVGSGPNKASAWARVGRPGAAVAGNIAVMSHHVGVIKSCTRTHCVIVSGNHQRGCNGRCVGLGNYPRSRFIAIRNVSGGRGGRARSSRPMSLFMGGMSR